ncbi:MAG: hypothetical protein ACOC1K_06060 [Nanoarchaeota archaeon]
MKIKKDICLLLILFLLFSFNTTAKELPETQISFDFKDIEIQEVLKSISKSSNINLVVGSELKDKISLELKEVPFSKAIEVITESNDLDYIYQNDILLIDTQKRIKEKYGDNSEEQEISKADELENQFKNLKDNLNNEIDNIQEEINNINQKIENLKQPETEKEPEPEITFKLNGIIEGENNIAIVKEDGKTHNLAESDHFQGYLVKKVTSDYMLIEKDGEETKLKK